MHSVPNTILSAALGAALVLAAGSALLSPTAPARLAPAQPTPAEARIATVDTLTVLQAMLDRSALKQEVQALAEGLTAALEAKQVEVTTSEQNLQALTESSRTRYMALPEGDPERDQILAAYNTASEFHNQLAASFEQMRTDSQAQFDKARADQLRACYAEMKQALAAMAGEGGYTHILSHATNDNQFTQFSFDAVIQGVRDRGVLIAPEGTDLTDAVLARLNVVRPVMDAPPGSGADGAPSSVPAQPILPPPGE